MRFSDFGPSNNDDKTKEIGNEKGEGFFMFNIRALPLNVSIFRT